MECPCCNKRAEELIICECESAAYCSEICRASDFNKHKLTCEIKKNLTIDPVVNTLLLNDEFRELLHVVAQCSNLQCEISHYAHLVDDEGITGSIYNCDIELLDGNGLLREFHMCVGDNVAIYSVSRSACEQIREKSNIISVCDMNFPLTLLCDDKMCKMVDTVDGEYITFRKYRIEV